MYRQKYGISFWNFVPNYALGKFGHDMSTIAECNKQVTTVG